MFSIETDRPTPQDVYFVKHKPYVNDLTHNFIFNINYFTANFLYRSVVENDVNMELILSVHMLQCSSS